MTQTETNLSRSAVTHNAGGDNVPNLLPGTYDVVVSLPGFQTSRAPDVAVRQGLDLRVDARLTGGALEESVIVSGQAEAAPFGGSESVPVREGLATSTGRARVGVSGRAGRRQFRRHHRATGMGAGERRGERDAAPGQRRAWRMGTPTSRAHAS